jgi:Glycosyltransferase family 87
MGSSKIGRGEGGRRNGEGLRRRVLGLLAAVVMAASVWFYFQRVLIPYQKADAATHGSPRGNLSDLYPRWWGAHELLLHGRDPYSDAVTREIQTGYYGRPLNPARPSDPKDQERFAYPLYVVFLLAPTINIPFPVVRAGFGWGLAGLTVISVWLWMSTLQWRSSRTTAAVVTILTVCSLAAVQGIKLQQLSLLVAFLIAAGAALLASGHLLLAGILLAAASIKPQLVILPAAWLLLWTLSGWRQRRQFFWGFLGAMALLLGGGEYLLPGWMGRFVQGLAAYERYTGGRSLLDVLAGRTGGTMLSVLLISGLAWTCWRLRCTATNTAGFDLSLALVLAVTVTVVPMMAPYNQILLLPAVLLIMRGWAGLWQRKPIGRMACSIALAIFFWPWIASLGLAISALLFPAASIRMAWEIPLWTSLFIPLAVLWLLALLLEEFLRTVDAQQLEGPYKLRGRVQPG